MAQRLPHLTGPPTPMTEGAPLAKTACLARFASYHAALPELPMLIDTLHLTIYCRVSRRLWART